MTTRSGAGDSWRLAVGTLTRVPVKPPSRVSRQTAGVAMLAAPLVGALVAVLPALVVLGLGAVAGPPLLTAALAVAALTWITRALHLDGLADVADGLGSRASPARAREVMKDPSVGAFAVVTVTLTLLLQVAAIASAPDSVTGAYLIVVAVVAGRLSLTWACRRGLAPATPTGLGAAMAGSVAPRWAAAVSAAVVLVVTATGALVGGIGLLVGGIAAMLAGLGAAEWMRRQCSRRFGGLTGDVLGAGVEVATTTALVVGVLVVGTL